MRELIAIQELTTQRIIGALGLWAEYWEQINYLYFSIGLKFLKSIVKVLSSHK